MTSTVLGAAVRLKVLEGTIVSTAADVALLPATVTVSGPLAAPVGMTMVMLVASKRATGAAMVPPPCALMVTWGPPVPQAGVGIKLLPVRLTSVPTEALDGVIMAMVG